MKTLYKVGIYCRLSVDDASNSAKARNYIPADESASIENQRELLSKFVMLNGWVETKTYVDDGYSGGNFQRPGFLEMLEDARKGVIDLELIHKLAMNVDKLTPDNDGAGKMDQSKVVLILFLYKIV